MDQASLKRNILHDGALEALAAILFCCSASYAATKVSNGSAQGVRGDERTLLTTHACGQPACACGVQPPRPEGVYTVGECVSAMMTSTPHARRGKKSPRLRHPHWPTAPSTFSGCLPNTPHVIVWLWTMREVGPGDPTTNSVHSGPGEGSSRWRVPRRFHPFYGAEGYVARTVVTGGGDIHLCPSEF
jgi:hypothetical protein